MGHDSDRPESTVGEDTPKQARSRRRAKPAVALAAPAAAPKPRRSRSSKRTSEPEPLAVGNAASEAAEPSLSDESPVEAVAETETGDETRAKIRLETASGREAIAALLEALAIQVRVGTLLVEQGGVSFALDVPSRVSLDVHASRKGKRGKLELRVGWKG